MATLSGFQVKAGYKKSGAWGTPVLVGSGDGVELRSESMPAAAESIRFKSASAISEQPAVVGRDVLAGSVSTDLAYQATDVLIAMAFGNAGAPVQQATSLAYRHTWTPKASLLGVYGTLVVAKKIDAWEYDSCKVTGLTIGAAPGRRTALEVKLLARKLNRNTSSGTNTNTTAGSITLPGVREFALFSHLAVRMNAQGGAALAAGDSVYVSSMSIDLDNVIEGVYTGSGGAATEEPDRTGFLAVALEIALTKYQSATLVDLGALKTAQKATVVFTGKVIDSGVPYSLTFYFPYLVADESAANAAGAGRVPVSARFSGFATASVPTGFPAGFTEAIGVEAVNQRSTDALA